MSGRIPYQKDSSQPPGSHAPVLHPALLARVHELNRDYVELLLLETVHPPYLSPIEVLPEKVRDALACVAPAWRAQIAACPFALYSLRFDDQQFWHTALDDLSSGSAVEPAHESLESRYAVHSARSLPGRFSEVAAFFAWHAATGNQVAARVLFAMPDALGERLSRTPLWQVRRVALEYPGLLIPRWPTNPGFWPDLVRFAGACDMHRLETARLLGSQLRPQNWSPRRHPMANWHACACGRRESGPVWSNSGAIQQLQRPLAAARRNSQSTHGPISQRNSAWRAWRALRETSLLSLVTLQLWLSIFPVGLSPS
ncbi:MAG TPA: hypothetical protein VGN07_13160 [Steroidobacteraceae bacterium]|jgi:hypothetical protein